MAKRVKLAGRVSADGAEVRELRVVHARLLNAALTGNSAVIDRKAARLLLAGLSGWGLRSYQCREGHELSGLLDECGQLWCGSCGAHVSRA